MAAAYSFVSRWRIAATPERCWQEFERMLRPDGDPWWPGVAIDDAPAGLTVGDAVTLAVRSPLGYRLRTRLTVTDLEPGRAIAATSTGDLHGEGRIEVAEAPSGSILVFRWDVVTEKAWMNATAFALRPVFAAAHAHVMRTGERGLRAAVERDL